MSLSTKKPGDVPKDALIVSKDEALVYFSDIINRWKITADVWPLRYGASILGGITVISSIYINNYYRTMLRLGRYGAFTTYLPIVVLPTIVATALHSVFVIPKVILYRPNDCPACLQIRSGLIQAFCAIIYPGVLAPVSALMYAQRHLTANLPSITEKPKSVLTILQKLNQRIFYPIVGLLAFNIFASSYIVYKEFDSVITINTKLAKLEELIDEAKEKEEQNIF